MSKHLSLILYSYKSLCTLFTLLCDNVERGIDDVSFAPTSLAKWMVSGPKRYDYTPSTDDWRYTRDGEEMGTLLEQELSRAFGRKVELGLGHVSEAVE